MITATVRCSACGVLWKDVQISREDMSRSDRPWFCSSWCKARGAKPEEVKQMITEKEKALNGVNSALRFFMTAETRAEADVRYKMIRDALDRYYKTVWEPEHETSATATG